MTKFVIFKDVVGYFRWRLIARNGEIVANSEGYSSKNAAETSARKVSIWASNAQVIA